MGYLVKNNFPAFNKALISTWFQIPTSVINAVPPNDYFGGAASGNWRQQGILPLVTFGSRTVVDYLGQPQALSHLGLDVHYINDGGGLLCSMLQTNVSVESSEQTPARFNLFGYEGFGNPVADGAHITNDVWQHALFSFDISGGFTAAWPEWPETVHLGGPHFTSGNRATWSLNNVSKNSVMFRPPGVPPDTDTTQIIPDTGWTWELADDEIHFNPVSFPGVSIPAGPLAIPSDATDSVFQIKMSHFSMWTGVFVDAGSEAVRRLFVDINGRPVPIANAITAFGKRPEVEFRTSADWLAGRNRGTAGNFTRVGTIFKVDTNVAL